MSDFSWSARRRTHRAGHRPSPIFLAIAGVCAVSGWALWSHIGPARLWVFVFVLSGWVVSLCLHEYGHAITAYHGGDRGVVEKGYLTLNPVLYAHPFLSIVLPLLFVLLGGIGLPGGAVYINPYALKGKRTETLVAAAGPMSNMAFTALLAWLVISFADAAHLEFWAALAYLCLLQLTASILNLLPVPGLDGYHMLEPWLPQHWVENARKAAPFAVLVLFGLLWEPRIGGRFFDGMYWLLGEIGVPELLVTYGSGLFRFWS